MNLTAATAITSKLFKPDTSGQASDTTDAPLYVIDGIYGLALVQVGNHIIAKLTVFDNNRQKTFVLGNVMDQFNPPWLNVSPDWRNEPSYSDFYNEFSFGEWIESIYKSVHEHNKKIDPEHVAAAAFSSGDEDFETRLLKILRLTKSITTEGSDPLRGASLGRCIIEIHKLSKFQVGLYALACASMKKEVSGMTEAAKLVINTAITMDEK